MRTEMAAMTLDAWFAHEEHAARGALRDAGERFRVHARDGYELGATLFAPEGAPRAIVLVASAMGVRRQFYAPFAAFLAEAGLAVLTLDYRGIGESRPTTLRGFDTSLHDWAELDLAAAVDELRKRFPGLPLAWVGHSVGGQLMGFVANANVAAALFVGSQSGYWKHWDGVHRLKMAALWHAAIPSVLPFAGYFPSKQFGLGEDLPAGVAREWASWGRDPDYLLVHARERSGAEFLRYTGPLRAIAISDDDFAPKRAVEALVDCYPFARSELVVVHPDEIGAAKIGHFGFFSSDSRETLWTESLSWILRSTGITSAGA